MQTNNENAEMIGNMNREEYDRLNKEGAEKVAAIKPDSEPLSASDEALITEVAKGGMMQLEIGKLAVKQVSDAEVKVLAQSEVDEQTGLGDKLKEIAQAKNITLPSEPDPKTDEIISKLKDSSGAEFDQTYVAESGVKNHEKLDEVMSKVEANAEDQALKDIAAAAHPLVRLHLKVSREIQAKL